MYSVSKESLLSQIEKLDDESMVCKLRDVVESVFDSIYWTPIKDGLVGVRENVEEWSSRSNDLIERDFTCLEINRSTILNALERYLEIEVVRIKDLDWLFLQLLTYAEYTATVIETRKRLLGIDKYVKQLSAEPRAHVYSVAPMFKRWWHWPFAILIFCLSFIFEPIGPVLCIVFFGFIKYNRRKLFNRMDLVFKEMLNVYESINTASIGWINFQNSLYESKKVGAMWDASLFALVESRIAARR